MSLFMLSRRGFAGLAGAALFGAGNLAFAAAPGSRKLVLVILRGGCDGLSAVPPYGDAAYSRLRPHLAIAAPGEAGGALTLREGLGLHPRLEFLAEAWAANELAVLHAAASPYRDRSHFDGQDVLESGAERVFGAADGWLNRALGALPTEKAGAVAIAATLPLVLRGPAPATNWAPSAAPAADGDTIGRLMDLYARDTLLGPALARAVETAEIVADAGMPAAGGRARGRFGPGAYRALAVAAAKLLAAPQGPAAAVLAFDGWDTHVNQGGADGQLAQRLAGLDAALAALKAGLGPAWAQTAVVVATEFGRTAAENGNRGTDHGTGAAAFVLGGAVKGGRIIGDWPSLAKLHENRDLAPANDLRGLFATVLEEHWGLERRFLTQTVFPGLAGARMAPGLVIA